MTCRLFGFAKHSGWEGIRKVPMRSDHINFTPLQYRFCYHIFLEILPSLSEMWHTWHAFLRTLNYKFWFFRVLGHRYAESDTFFQGSHSMSNLLLLVIQWHQALSRSIHAWFVSVSIYPVFVRVAAPPGPLSLLHHCQSVLHCLLRCCRVGRGDTPR